MLDFYQQLAQFLAQEPVVLATVTRVIGSVPREVGAKMLICADSKIYGTIGGGAGEAKVIHQALQVLKTGEKQSIEIDLSESPQRQTEGVCGGKMQVWLERWEASHSLNLVQQIISLLQIGKTAVLITPLQPQSQLYLEVENKTKILDNNLYFTETIVPPPTLLIVGAGHVAVPLAKVANLAGFQIIVQDDRPDFANGDRFPMARLILNKPLTVETQNLLPSPNHLYAALVTRSYQYDLASLRLLLNLPLRYIGTIGSKKRFNKIEQELKNEGFSPEKIQQIYSPIGLNIGALTPEEIAISICAELIQVRRSGTGRSLSKQLCKSPQIPI